MIFQRFGFGLKSLRERIAALGGTCRLEVGIPDGAVLRAVIPIDGAAIPRFQI